MRVALFLLLVACSGCAQHDLFSPGRISSGEATARLLYRFPPPDLCPYGGGAQSGLVDVDTTGNVTHVESLTGKEAGRAAFPDAVKRWRYKPLLQQGQPIPFTTTVILSVSCGM